MAYPTSRTIQAAALLPHVVGEPSLQAQLDALRAENEALRSQRAAMAPKLGLKVSEKGGLSVYGLGRFPVTLYREQWIKLLSMAKTIEQFIADHDRELQRKQF